MKLVDYKVLDNDNIGSGIPYGATFKAVLVAKGDSNDGLLYFPRKVKYTFNGVERMEKGCGSLSFAVYDKSNKAWVKSGTSYINLEKKESKKYEL